MAHDDLKHKIYIFNNGGKPGWLNVMALADDGHVLAGHICSHESFIPHDMGISSNWKHKEYDAHFGAGNWELELVPSDQVLTHEGLEDAYRLNQAHAQARKEG